MFFRRCWPVPVLLFVVFMFTTVVPAFGVDIEELKNKREDLQRGIENDRKIIIDAKREISSLTDQIRLIDNKIDYTNGEINKLNRQLEEVEKQVKETETKLQEAEAKLAERTDIFSDRLKEIYMNGEVNYLEVLLQSTSLTDFLVRMDLLQKIAEQDMKFLDELKAERERIARMKAELQAKRNEIADLKQEAVQRRAQLEEQEREKNRVLARITSEKEAAERALAEKEKASRQLAAKIRQLQSSKNRGTYSSGVMSWPVPGYHRVTSDYGMRMHPILNSRRMHTGIDVGAPTGANVVAMAGGEAIFVGWFGAYGNTVVLDHGGGVSTMYAHLSSCSVGVGQKVARGQKVGQVGSTGLSTGPHLHFEVRVNGDHVNPWSYLR